MGPTRVMNREIGPQARVESGLSGMRLHLPLLFLLLASLACSPLWGRGDPTSAALHQPGEYQGMSVDALGAHRARFDLQFDGRNSWLYRVETRMGDGGLERSLHIEGVSDARNPGDVRMVTRDQESRMYGPGTDEQCLRFPRSMEMNITFLGPDDVIPPGSIHEPLVSLGTDQIAGRDVVHYAVVQAELDRWQEVSLGLWLEPDSGAVLRYDLKASGTDPYFQAGFGDVEGRYEVLEIGSQSIEPIPGCEIQLPLPPEAENLVRLPGVVSFETELSLEDTLSFYRQSLGEAGWEPLAGEERGSGAVVISYRREGERLDITIRAMGDHTRVELLTDD